MLTCEICGEENLMEEDMKTHLLLSHLENDMHCPLCSLSGVSYDELCFHISSAHPETPHKEHHTPVITSTSSCSARTNTEPQTVANVLSSQPCMPVDSCDTASVVATHSVQPKQKNTFPGVKPEHNKPKQKRLSSPTEEKLFPCPMCALVCSSCFILQEHVELHLQEQISAEGSPLEVCSPATTSLSARSLSGSPGSDLKLARQLQQEEEQRRRQEEAQQERVEFKKLQRQFGLDSRGGYSRQMERTMERAVSRGLMAPTEFHCKRAEMMESLASGVDDGSTRTQGVLRALYEYYQNDCRDSVHVWLSADTDHYCSSVGDKGWGCGYRNFQMLLSSLHRIDMYAPILQEKAVPGIPQVQRMMEGAWKEGIDPQGASHFNQRLHGTQAWIGATEIFSLLTCLGISACINDFHQPTGPGDTHPLLFEWVKQYFSQTNKSGRLPPRIIHTSLPPLYLQHQGHSRSIVGLEQKKNGSLCLLLLDPGSSVSNTRKLLSKDTVSTAIRQVRKFPGSLKHKQYQVVVVRGVLSAEERQISIMNSRTLCAEKIP
ncbi:hypothetical protein D5F01_LYC12182 [Larimichthys crocea]|uniref:Zinc finger-containing ubiquitin peptidase 1 n=1 Tax=Larimichthys crocea TaxID=215358 RepID=A0A6G0IAE0_LARCR|nr:zinc finger-containing ubiquitin peptidase 1 isoform X2 [Larimichthys crocea]KAE8288317.1 hypothetical protein D5F01_LYC12182 [Larimichthys crocea]